jgi:muconolactone delta-isomerase
MRGLMQFLTVSRRRTERFAEVEFAARVEEERAQARALYAEGFIRQIWQRGDVPGACIVVEADSEAHARERLNTLPLYQAGMIEFSLIPLNPYTGFCPARRP